MEFIAVISQIPTHSQGIENRSTLRSSAWYTPIKNHLITELGSSLVGTLFHKVDRRSRNYLAN